MMMALASSRSIKCLLSARRDLRCGIYLIIFLRSAYYQGQLHLTIGNYSSSPYINNLQMNRSISNNICDQKQKIQFYRKHQSRLNCISSIIKLHTPFVQNQDERNAKKNQLKKLQQEEISKENVSLAKRILYSKSIDTFFSESIKDKLDQHQLMRRNLKLKQIAKRNKENISWIRRQHTLYSFQKLMKSRADVESYISNISKVKKSIVKSRKRLRGEKEEPLIQQTTDGQTNQERWIYLASLTKLRPQPINLELLYCNQRLKVVSRPPRNQLIIRLDQLQNLVALKNQHLAAILEKVTIQDQRLII